MKTSVEKVSGACDRSLAISLALLMLMLVLSISWQVASRYLVREPSAWTEELARFLLIWIGMLGAAYGYRTHAHMAVDILAEKLSGQWRMVLKLLITLTVLLFATTVMIVGGAKLVQLTLELNQISAALGVKMGLVYLVIPVSGGLITFYGLLDLSASIASLRQSSGSGAV